MKQKQHVKLFEAFRNELKNKINETNVPKGVKALNEKVSIPKNDRDGANYLMLSSLLTLDYSSIPGAFEKLHEALPQADYEKMYGNVNPTAWIKHILEIAAGQSYYTYWDFKEAFKKVSGGSEDYGKWNQQNDGDARLVNIEGVYISQQAGINAPPLLKLKEEKYKFDKGTLGQWKLYVPNMDPNEEWVNEKGRLLVGKFLKAEGANKLASEISIADVLAGKNPDKVKNEFTIKSGWEKNLANAYDLNVNDAVKNFAQESKLEGKSLEEKIVQYYDKNISDGTKAKMAKLGLIKSAKDFSLNDTVVKNLA